MKSSAIVPFRFECCGPLTVNDKAKGQSTRDNENFDNIQRLVSHKRKKRRHATVKAQVAGHMAVSCHAAEGQRFSPITMYHNSIIPNSSHSLLWRLYYFYIYDLMMHN